MNKLSFKFSQLDSWFFREARPMESVGGSELSSVFPPPVTTMAGAIRTLLGDLIELDWQKYNKHEQQSLAVDVNEQQLIGHGEDTADLRFSYPVIEVCEKGVWLTLTPAPIDLLELKEDKKLICLGIGKDVVQSDLGCTRLPELPAGVMGAKPLENVWLKPAGWKAYQQGQLPNADQLVRLSDLIEKESRLGIARDNVKGAVESGMLYQTEHIRLKRDPNKFDDIRLCCEVSGIPQSLNDLLLDKPQAVRLGGEGRLAFVEVVSSKNEQNVQLPATEKVKLVLTSPACFKQGWLPSGFEKVSQEGVDVFVGKIADQDITIIAQVNGKPQRIGGWDSATNAPKPLRSFMPVGCCWYLKCTDASALQATINEKGLGEFSQFGYGKGIVLPWKD